MTTSLPDPPSPMRPAADSSHEAIRASVRELLESVRARTELLMSTVTEEQATSQHSPLMGPLVWDLGHIAAFEELWLQRQLEGEIRFSEMPGTFNPFEHPRPKRGELDLPSLSAALAELRRIRNVTLERLSEVRFDERSALLDQGYVYRMVAQHESQHQETMLQALQLRRSPEYTPPVRTAVPRTHAMPVREEMVEFPGGDVLIGTTDRAAAYDNERPAHHMRVAPFLIDVMPVTNGDYLEFVEQGGYENSRYWTREGWQWRIEVGATLPGGWEWSAGSWFERHMDLGEPLELSRPVCHVSYHEAEAYARFAGKRLPTEIEWEAAALWDPATGSKREYPWGDEPASASLANVDQLTFGTAPVGAYARNISPIGCVGMIGDVWEWTSSDFQPYPGFQAFPYPEYSEVFFGTEYKVLRGGSWATAAHVARGSFRNWDFPIRRQIFSGFRCARDR